MKTVTIIIRCLSQLNDLILHLCCLNSWENGNCSRMMWELKTSLCKRSSFTMIIRNTC